MNMIHGERISKQLRSSSAKQKIDCDDLADCDANNNVTVHKARTNTSKNKRCKHSTPIQEKDFQGDGIIVDVDENDESQFLSEEEHNKSNVNMMEADSSSESKNELDTDERDPRRIRESTPIEDSAKKKPDSEISFAINEETLMQMPGFSRIMEKIIDRKVDERMKEHGKINEHQQSKGNKTPVRQWHHA